MFLLSGLLEPVMSLALQRDPSSSNVRPPHRKRAHSKVGLAATGTRRADLY